MSSAFEFIAAVPSKTDVKNSEIYFSGVLFTFRENIGTVCGDYYRRIPGLLPLKGGGGGGDWLRSNISGVMPLSVFLT